MTADDLAVVVRGMTPVVREYVASQVDPLLKTIAGLEQRLAVAEQRPLVPGPAGKDAAVDFDGLALKAATFVPSPRDGRDGVNGTNVTVEDVVPLIAAEVHKAVSALPVPKDGRDGVDGTDGTNGRDGTNADPVDLDALAVKAALLIHVPKDGQDGKDAEPIDMDALALKAAELIPAPKDGRDGANGASVDPAVVAQLVLGEVTKAVTALPRPENGTSVTVDDVVPLIAAQVEKAVAAIPPVKDGVGVVTMLQDRQGHLRVTLTDGQTQDVGMIAGRDGDHGKDIDPAVVKAMIVEEVAKIPLPKDGQDGAGFPEMDGEYDEHGRLMLTWPNGKSIRVPSVVDRGVWRAETAYLKGDGVTWGGSFFIAQVEAPTTKPETSKEWRLAIKHGADGKSIKGQDGKPGRDGKDFSPPSLTGGRF